MEIIKAEGGFDAAIVLATRNEHAPNVVEFQTIVRPVVGWRVCSRDIDETCDDESEIVVAGGLPSYVFRVSAFKKQGENRYILERPEGTIESFPTLESFEDYAREKLGDLALDNGLLV